MPYRGAQDIQFHQTEVNSWPSIPAGPKRSYKFQQDGAGQSASSSYFPEEWGGDSPCPQPQDNALPFSRMPQACCAHGPELTPSPPPPLSTWNAGSLPWEPPISAIRQAQGPGSSVCTCQPVLKATPHQTRGPLASHCD
uniref:Uncharacterized protein n=1 Tax=Myotis myotis TaxID=51298 RepID=A0A7J7WHG7_MYOMY|nr:hypothetical protein mMyoMyo1_012082 [Myotis myotis]